MLTTTVGHKKSEHERDDAVASERCDRHGRSLAGESPATSLERRQRVGEGKGARRNSLGLPDEGINGRKGANEGSEGSRSQNCHPSLVRTSGRLCREGEVPAITEARYPFRNPAEYRRWVGKESERSYPVKGRLFRRRGNCDRVILSGAEMLPLWAGGLQMKP